MVIYSKVTEAPDSEPVTLEEAKAQLRIDGTDRDTEIATLIKAARRIAEAYAGLSFITQTRTVKLDKFPKCNGEIILPYGPVSQIDSIEYVDDDGATQELTDVTDYTADLHSELARVLPVDSWPSTKVVPNAVTVTYVAGYGDADSVPEEVKQAIKMIIASLNENPMDEVSHNTNMINWSSKALLDCVKVYWNATQD